MKDRVSVLKDLTVLKYTGLGLCILFIFLLNAKPIGGVLVNILESR